MRQIRLCHANTKKCLIKSPKLYIRDPGLLNALLRIKFLDDLQAHPVLGGSREGFVIEQIIALLPANSEIFFHRSIAGAEIDLFFRQEESARCHRNQISNLKVIPGN
jgi:uncharacterized protein